jgi:hypothetical protein
MKMVLKAGWLLLAISNGGCMVINVVRDSYVLAGVCAAAFAACVWQVLQ